MRRFYTLMQFGIFMLVSLGLMLMAFVEDSDAGPKKALLVNVHDQVLYAVDDFKIVYEFDVITGRPGKETTAGKFTVFKKLKTTPAKSTK